MSANAPRRAPATAGRSHGTMMTLRELVDRYLSLAGEFGKPAALASFSLPPEETERVFSSYDEDYHISRFFHFSDSGGKRYVINGALATHVSVDSEVRRIL